MKDSMFSVIGHSEHTEDCPIKGNDDKDAERDGMFPSLLALVHGTGNFSHGFCSCHS